MSINRGDLLKALREKYFGDAEGNAEVISDWKPDKVHDVKVHTWEHVSFNRLPPIFVVSINRIVNRFNDGSYAEIKLNDSFNFPLVRANDCISIQESSCFVAFSHHMDNIVFVRFSKRINCDPRKDNLPMKSSSIGSDSSPFMKVKEELLRQRKKRRIGTRRKEKREIKVGKKR
jgi:hypothetical protein